MAKRVAKKQAEVDALDTNEIKNIVDDGISRASEELGGDVAHFRYKVLRAIAFQAFINIISEGGEEAFTKLVDQAVENSGDLPSGWSLGNTKKKASKTKVVKASVVAEDEEEDEEEEASKKRPTPRAKKKVVAEEEEEIQEELELDEIEDEEEEEEAPKPVRRRRPRR